MTDRPANVTVAAHERPSIVAATTRRRQHYVAGRPLENTNMRMRARRWCPRSQHKLPIDHSQIICTEPFTCTQHWTALLAMASRPESSGLTVTLHVKCQACATRWSLLFLLTSRKESMCRHGPKPTPRPVPQMTGALAKAGRVRMYLLTPVTKLTLVMARLGSCSGFFTANSTYQQRSGE